jgi:SnoaL-like domain
MAPDLGKLLDDPDGRGPLLIILCLSLDPPQAGRSPPERDTAWAMSEENVAIVQRYCEENLPAPEQLPDWVAGFFEADSDYYPARKIPAARPCHGREEIVAYLMEFRAAWEGLRYVVKEARAIGDDRVLVHGAMWAEGRASGATLEGDLYSCFWLRNGRFFRVEGHLTPAGALNAMGLRGDSLEAAGLRE